MYTGHKALVWLYKVKDMNAKLGRWELQLQNYNFEVVYREGKSNKNADAISRLSFPIKEKIDQNQEDFPPSIVNSVTSEKTVNSENHDKITEIRFEYEQNSPICSVIENQN